MTNRISLRSMLPAVLCSLLVACVGEPGDDTLDDDVLVDDELADDAATEAAAVATVPPSAIGPASFIGACGTATATPARGRVDLRFAGARTALAAGASRANGVCQVKLTVAVPAGRVLSAEPAVFTGQAQVAAGIEATAAVRFALGGAVAPAGITNLVNGAFRATSATGVTSGCGQPAVLKATVTTTLARRSGNGAASVDLATATLPGLAFVPCP